MSFRNDNEISITVNVIDFYIATVSLKSYFCLKQVIKPYLLYKVGLL